MNRIRVMGRTIPLPNHWLLRAVLGIALVLGGIFSFLPILGIWMLPLGLIVLSVDFPAVRRFRRRCTVRLVNWAWLRWPNVARKLGLGRRRVSRGTT